MIEKLELEEDRRGGGRRRGDEMRAWLPMFVQLGLTLLALGAFYGELNGRLTLIEYRIGQVERKVP